MKTLLLLASLALAVLPARAADSAPVPASPVSLAAASGLPIVAIVAGTPKAADGSTITVTAAQAAWIAASMEAGVVQDYAAATVASWTAQDFLARFSDAELVAITTAARTDANVAVLLLKFNAATTVRADDARLLAGLDYLVAQSLLTAPRKAQLLGSGSSP